MGGSVCRPLAVRRLRDCGARLSCAAVLLSLMGLTDARGQAACAPALAHVVSVQGRVEIRRGDAAWVAVERNAPLCRGDTIRVLQYGRAALQLSNETMLRLDQGTTVTLAPPDAGKATLLEQVSGALHVITRTPRAFSVKTPFVNANVDGTEFAVRTTDDSATVVVFEGVVQATNAAGSTTLASGEQATAGQGDVPPVKSIVVRPLDAVAWTLYFPAVFDYRLRRFGGEGDAAQRRSVALYREGRFSEALTALGASAPGTAVVPLLTYRAGLLLLVGRLAEARIDLDAALRLDPANSDAHALQSVIALVENDNERAYALARLATGESPDSPAALIALSYAQQARFELEPALASVRRAIELDPASALAHARSAELEMSLGRLDAALAAAQQAVRLDPDLARTQSVLGFANLTRIDTAAARASFERAIDLDQTDPLPRLGLGLATVRDGDLAAGRAEIEIAAILDPANSLVRSYLGKAYYEEKRDATATDQFALAIRLDPRDPTPYFYRAVMEQADNRPVQAVRDLEQSITLNDNRAVFRSRLYLDQDLAARSVRLAYIYRDLGFQQVAALEAVKALSLDPTEPAAHRFLADSSVGQLRTEGARVSELLQSQLRQPLGMNALQPQLFRGQNFFVEGVGPAQSGGYEFAPLFTRNGIAARLDAVAGSASTVGDQLVLSGLQDSIAFSLGQFHFETDGLRANNDLNRDVYSAFLQVGLSPSVRLQAQVTDDFAKQGDLSLQFDPADFYPRLRENTRLSTARLGGYFAFDPRSDLVVSAIAGSAKDRQFLTDDPTWFNDDRERLQSLEAQYAYRGTATQVLAGLSAYRNKTTLDDGTGPLGLDTREESAYGFVTLTGLSWGLVPQIGLSYDRYDRPGRTISGVDPKLGLIWSLPTDTTIRAAAFRTLKRTFVADQTLQPTQIAGFNQFYDDVNGTRSSVVGLGIDQRFAPDTFIGAQATGRNLEVPTLPGEPDYRWTERAARLYAYHVFNATVTLTAEVLRERFQRPEAFTSYERFTNLDTTFVPIGLRLNSLGNWSASFAATGVRQQIRYQDLNDDLVGGSSRFVVVDASLSYRLPGRVGMVSVEARNLFDKQFRYQEIDFFATPRVFPGRLFFARLSVAL
jgi:tetratricopeptide (TPR) repeat protein